jgi:hypothetical protein
VGYNNVLEEFIEVSCLIVETLHITVLFPFRFCVCKRDLLQNFSHNGQSYSLFTSCVLIIQFEHVVMLYRFSLSFPPRPQRYCTWVIQQVRFKCVRARHLCRLRVVVITLKMMDFILGLFVLSCFVIFSNDGFLSSDYFYFVELGLVLAPWSWFESGISVFVAKVRWSFFY